eukprot:TRINITY_DN67776_c11_g2_i1.p1 TRINITY_DN67776_c11_g2~~TRINITY_DN67776_c11_g2_i1.p1  ORF type:complete len:385 (-),score=55.76 TRINITY_DN67776_c11_g2_i1:947-2101(-)
MLAEEGKQAEGSVFATDHEGCVTQLLSHKDLLVSSSLDSTIRCWNVQTGAAVRTLSGHSGGVNCLCLQHTDEHGDVLFSGSDDKQIKIWKFDDGACLRTLRVGDAVNCLLWWNNRLYSGGDDNVVRIWEKTGNCVSQLKGHKDWVYGLSTHDEKLYSCSDDGSVKVWAPDSDTAEVKFHKTIEFGPDAEELMAAVNAALQTMSASKNKPAGEGAADGEELAEDQGGEEVEGDDDEEWEDDDEELDEDTRLAMEHAQKMTLEDMQKMAEDGDKVAVDCMLIVDSTMYCGYGGDIVVYDLQTGKQKEVLNGHEDRVGYLAGSADKKMFFSCSDDLSIRVWDRTAEECKCVSVIENAHTGPVFCAVQVGEALFSGSDDNSIKKWTMQ